MKFFKSLPARLVLGIVIGVLSGLVLPREAMSVVLTVKNIINELIDFCVPLIVIGFIAPSITRLGGGATKMLGIAITIAYLSSLLASLMSTLAGYVILPHMHIVSDPESLRELPAVIFSLEIPQIMPVMSALVLSVLFGLGTIWAKATKIIDLLQELQEIILEIVKEWIIPLLPYFIAVTFCTLTWQGTLTKQLPIFLLVILIVLAGHFLWLTILYGTASVYSGHSGLEVVRHYGPAYLTAVGTMSSAATLPVALECAHKSKYLRKDIVNFSIPLFSNIHLCGSVLTEVFFVMTVSKVLYGHLPTVGDMLLFCFLLGVFAIGAPGVPGGTVMASLGLIIGILGFDGDGTALMLAVFALQDSFGTACNVTGDGALSMILTGYAEKHNIQEEES